MADDDDATVMISAMDQAPGHQFKDVGGDEADEATVMWSPETDLQNAATVTMSAGEAEAALRQASAPAPAVTSGGGTGLMTLGAIGFFILIPFLALLHVFGDPTVMRFVIKENLEQGVVAAGGFGGFLAFLFIALGMFQAKRQAGAFSIVAGVFALLIGLTYLMAGISAAAESKDLFFLFVMSPKNPAGIATLAPLVYCLSWFMLALWGFLSTRATGGMGITGGIFSVLVSLLFITPSILVWTKALNRSAADVLGFVMIGAVFCAILVAIFYGIGMLKARRA